MGRKLASGIKVTALALQVGALDLALLKDSDTAE